MARHANVFYSVSFLRMQFMWSFTDEYEPIVNHICSTDFKSSWFYTVLYNTNIFAFIR